MPTAQPKAAQQVPARTAARQHHREAGGLSRLHERCEGEACRTSSAVCWAGLLHGTSSTSNAGSWAALAVVWAALRSSCDMSALMGGSVENERVQRFAPNLQSPCKIITFAADTCKIAAKLAITDAKHVQAKKGDGQKQKGLSGWPTLTTQNITHWCFESAGYDPNGLQRRDGRAPQWSGAA